MALPRPLQPVPQQHLLPLQPCLPTGRTVPGSSGDRAKRGGGAQSGRDQWLHRRRLADFGEHVPLVKWDHFHHPDGF